MTYSKTARIIEDFDVLKDRDFKVGDWVIRIKDWSSPQGLIDSGTVSKVLEFAENSVLLFSDFRNLKHDRSSFRFATEKEIINHHLLQIKDEIGL